MRSLLPRVRFDRLRLALLVSVEFLPGQRIPLVIRIAPEELRQSLSEVRAGNLIQPCHSMFCSHAVKVLSGHSNNRAEPSSHSLDEADAGVHGKIEPTVAHPSLLCDGVDPVFALFRYFEELLNLTEGDIRAYECVAVLGDDNGKDGFDLDNSPNCVGPQSAQKSLPFSLNELAILVECIIFSRANSTRGTFLNISPCRIGSSGSGC